MVIYLLGALVVLAVLTFVVLPLVRRQARVPAVPPMPSLAEQRAAIYRELTELELDQRVGKVTEADFKETSELLLARAAALISDEDAEAADLDARVEREIAEARARLEVPVAATAREVRS